MEFEERTVKEHLGLNEQNTQAEEHDGGNRLVLPGEEIADSMDILPGHGSFREGSKVLSKFVGVARQKGSVVTVTPLNGVYFPQDRDYVIGEIVSIGFSNWSVNINSPYDATLSTNDAQEFIERNADLSKYYKLGDLIFARVSNVTSTGFINVATKDPKGRKLIGGIVVEISPAKVPRLIGKAGSMINMIKDKTGCLISVGQNGRVWLKGENEDVAIAAVHKISELAHTTGLTDKMDEFLTTKMIEKQNAKAHKE